jgi:hypothetical protein
MRKKYSFNNLADLLLKNKADAGGTKEVTQKFASYLSVIALGFVFLLSGKMSAQTTHISPTGDGGFENGASFAANGWTADTPATVTKNQWFVGGAIGGPTSGFTGANCCYITNNAIGTPPPHSYTINLSCASHIYRDITISATETSIALDFSWIGNGETTNDRLRVWLTTTAFTPINGAGITANATRVLASATNYINQGTWTNATSVPIPAGYAGTTFRLIFEWVNNNSIGTQPPAAIDNISLVSVTPAGCTTPAAPTAYAPGTKTTTTLPATFSGTANGYLVIQSTSATPPTQPVNGTLYTGANIATLGAGLTFIQSSASTVIPGTGLTGNTQYYYYIFAYNNTSCSGGPAYNTGGPLTGPGITCPDVPTSVATASVLYNAFTLNWAAPAGGSAAAITYIVEVATDAGFTAPVIGSPFSVSAPTVTLNVTGLTANTPYFYRILARTSCDSANVGGTVTTALTPCVAPAQANTFVLGAVTSTTIAATFSGTANNYLVIRSLTNTAPVTPPANGTTYNAGNVGTLGAAFTFIQSGASTSIADSTLASGTQYYYFIYAYNNTACSGGPTYSAAAPLGGSGTTTAAFNDNCATATTLTVNGTPTCTVSTSGTTVGATQSQAACSGTADDDVWYKFVATGTSQIITVTPNTLSDAVFQVFSGACGSLASIGCVDATFGSSIEAATLTGATIGNTYYIRLHSYSNGASQGTFTICITSPPPPPTNGTCASATALPCGTSNLAGTTIGTANVAHGTSCGMSNYGVWYTFTGDGQQTTITSTANGGFDHEMSISSGSCGAYTAITCQDVGDINESETYTFNTVAGVNYYVYIADFVTGSSSAYAGSFTISRTCNTPGTPPANNLCSTATALPCGTSNLVGTTVNTTNIAHGTGCTMSNYGVWYTFTGDGNQTTISSTATGGFDHEMSISSGSCGAFSNIACVDASFTNGTETAVFTAALGTVYYVYIAYYNATTTTGNFIISRSCTTPPPPMTNDECSGAIALIPDTTCSFTTYTNATATASGGIPAPGCANYSGGDVWFSVVVPGNGILHIDTQSIIIKDGGMAVYTGACGSLALLECDDSDSADLFDMPYITRTGLTPGSTIYIRVWEYGNNNNGTFGICVTSPTSCTTGPGTGVTSLGCPSVVSGGLSLSGVDPAPVNACVGSTCVDLEATYLQLGLPTSYNVSSIPYAPPYQYGCLQNPVSVNVDDIWSPTITLPFNFCFYGTSYNQCLIGSNGVLTFDLAGNAPGGTNAWSFSNNIPSASLFKNTIFGVYHDIDPSIGGEVGYELITLNSGCRALVAAWTDVPMFSDNSILYTGMMVLYENTNIIEVYIKEKKIDDNNVFPWNNGNAIVGIQNGAGTSAVAAPNRNGLDANWTATNEAWRFTPSGASITSLKWYQGSGTAGAVLGTTSTLNVCPTSTTTYTAEVTYAICNSVTPIKVTDETTVTVNNGKTWNGSVSTDWQTANNWTPTGIPNSTDCVTVPLIPSRNPIVSATGNGLAGTLNVLANATLTVNSTCALTVTDGVTVQPTGTFQILNNGSLIQVSNATNTGNIKYYRDASIRKLDYVYWSSPVVGFNVNNISSPITPGPIYTWNTLGTNPIGGQGTWVAAAGQIMTKGIGYIVRGPDTFTTTAQTLSGLFTGVPHNGTFTVPIYRGSDQDPTPHNSPNGTPITNYSDNYNLLGNPYPSALRGSQFLVDNQTKVEGNIKLWTHGQLPASAIPNPFYNSFLYNYSVGDYLTWNFTGTTCCPVAADDLFIGAAQGFVIQMKDGATGSDVVTFNNTMRSAAFPNNVFYRTGNHHTGNDDNVDGLERHRIWLDLVDGNTMSDRALVGYIEGATNDRDGFYDANTLITPSMTLYSLIGTEAFTIQGRNLPFDENDKVPLGLIVPAAGTFKIAIAAVDGLFTSAGRNIYLEDKDLQIIHNLRQEPYSFSANAGTFNNRFILRFDDGSLGVNENTATDLSAFIHSDKLFVSANENIEKIEIFEVSGKLVKTYTPKENSRTFKEDFAFANGVYFAKIKLESGLLFTKKLMN